MTEAHWGERPWDGGGGGGGEDGRGLGGRPARVPRLAGRGTPLPTGAATAAFPRDRRPTGQPCVRHDCAPSSAGARVDATCCFPGSLVIPLWEPLPSLGARPQGGALEGASRMGAKGGGGRGGRGWWEGTCAALARRGGCWVQKHSVAPGIRCGPPALRLVRAHDGEPRTCLLIGQWGGRGGAPPPMERPATTRLWGFKTPRGPQGDTRKVGGDRVRRDHDQAPSTVVTRAVLSMHQKAIAEVFISIPFARLDCTVGAPGRHYWSTTSKTRVPLLLPTA